MSEMKPAPPRDRPVTGAKASLSELTNPEFFKTRKYREQQWRPDTKFAHPALLEFINAFQRRLAQLKVPMFAHCVWRTHSDQNQLYIEGRSNARGGESLHNIGCAVDLIHSTRGWELSDDAWKTLGYIGQELALQRGIGIRWGGDWDGDGDFTDQRLYDPAHWELQKDFIKKTSTAYEAWKIAIEGKSAHEKEGVKNPRYFLEEWLTRCKQKE